MIGGRWPWSDLDPAPSVMRAAGGRCELWAEKIQESIGGYLMQIKPKSGGFIGPVRNKSNTIISTEFAEHWAVRVGDMVYDRITGPNGLSFSEYRRLFDFGDFLDFVEMRQKGA